MAVKQIPNLPAGIALNGLEELEAVQAGTSVRVTSAQIASLASPFSGSPLSVPLGGTGLSGGTSGGLLYFNGSASIASSAALASGALVVGGGAGGPPSTTSTGAGVITSLGNAINTAGGFLAPPAVLGAGSLVIGGGSGTGPATTTTGTGVVSALGVNVGTNGSFVVQGGALGTPLSGDLANCTGVAISGVSGLGTNVAAALGVNVGTNGSFVVQGGALGTPTSGTLSSCTGLPLGTGVTGTLPTANGGTGLTSFTANQAIYSTSTSALTSGTLPIGAGGTGLSSTTSSTIFSTIGLAIGETGATSTYNLVFSHSPVFTGAVRLSGSTSGYVDIQSPATVATSYVFTLPADDGSTGQVLTTDGSGVTSWSSPSASLTISTTPISGGTSGRILYVGPTNVLQQYSVTGSAGNAVLSSGPTISNLLLSAGVATVGGAPLKFASGTNLTTAEAGAFEYDGRAFYSTPIGTQRGVISAEQFFRLNSNLAGANVTTAQNVFGVGVTLSASTVYRFEIAYTLVKTAGTTSHTISVLFGGTATLNNIYYNIAASNETLAYPTTDITGWTPENGSHSLATALIITTGITAATADTSVFISGTVSVNAGGTFIPQYILSAAPGGAYSTIAGGYMRISPIGASGANVSVGTWA